MVARVTRLVAEKFVLSTFPRALTTLSSMCSRAVRALESSPGLIMMMDRVVERSYMPEELVALGETVATLGETTFDVYLNARTFWRNVSVSVWRCKLGGYQVLKKWLSYRERSILNRPLKPEEIQHFADTGRRIATMVLASHAGTVKLTKS